MSNNINVLHYRDLREKGYGSQATIWRKVKAGKFPKPIDCAGRPAWPESVINNWLESKIKQAAS